MLLYFSTEPADAARHSFHLFIPKPGNNVKKFGLKERTTANSYTAMRVHISQRIIAMGLVCLIMWNFALS